MDRRLLTQLLLVLACCPLPLASPGGGQGGQTHGSSATQSRGKPAVETAGSLGEGQCAHEESESPGPVPRQQPP